MNVTTLLVLATLFISVSNALPRTSYVKLIDIYLIFNLLIPFLEIILHTFLNILEEDLDDEETPLYMGARISNEVRRNSTKKRGWWTNLRRMLKAVTSYGLPVAYFAFVIIFFLIGWTLDGTFEV